ncbi:thiosulfate sulfurtransferase/rhodanese-like domain-containing protein 3 [Agrilus planipennis]|uniref:Thiosulfate sulfurtransferase/rhodanese-like domain-containing protein 3 n=1 Tax=Agrilus planipennis TaxID=224129 RepID=A0A1W4XSM6_AGRPL|nr:thiosulfate sulfurtransferase/rhodanese-like domain-containing protein 3 [Agrilus planipennis]
MDVKTNAAVEGYLNALLLDVRDRCEVENTKQICGSINIPVTELVNAFNEISELEFKTRYGFKKPGPDCPIIICYQAGVRAAHALRIMQRLGYRKVFTYKGMHNC